ncbi:GNAT family N-acetyltransferase [Sagittula sp. S175]|uniref:GNAT family N-acetyltransferase n=1 Tax=Sagittula sp. S175 TaxID=3415129 RepID=UPI003C7E681D
MTLDLIHDLSRMDLPATFAAIRQEHWGTDLSEDDLRRAFLRSACLAAFDGATQVGFARAVSDGITSAYLKDVVVFKGHRGRGIGRALVEGLFNHPDLQEVRAWTLGTRDAGRFYAGLGFRPVPGGIFMTLTRKRP